MIIDSHNHHHIFTEKMQRCQEYVEALEEERRKIQVFERELPLCLELVTQTIEACKQQLSGTTTEYFHAQSECSEQTSSEGPFLEEFIPIKRTSPSDDDDGDEEEDQEEGQSRKPKDNSNKDRKNVDKSSKKSDWLRSVQLWNQTSDPPTKQDTPRKITVMEVERNGGAFHPFKREKSINGNTSTKSKSPSSDPAAAASPTVETRSDGSKKEEKEGQSQRKSRRSWSPELHKQFLHALQQLGGSHAATPKQIREVMKVDGLTNDEVKSHLQKYRLHTRKPSPSVPNNNNPQAPQFVVVGGIWVQPPEYAAVAAAAAAAGEASGVAAVNGIYAPIAAPPPPTPQRTQRQPPKKPGHYSEDGGVHSNSPANSSSTHASMVSPKL